MNYLWYPIGARLRPYRSAAALIARYRYPTARKKAMPFIPVPGAYSLNMKYTLDSQQIHNIWNIAPLVEGESFSIPATLAVVAGWYESDMASNFSADLLLQEITIRSLAIPDAPGVVYTTGLPIVGGKGTQSLPNNDAFCVTLRTGLSGRSNRGRSYFSGIANTDVVRSHLDPVVGAEIVASMNSLIGTLQGDANTMLVVVSRAHDGAPRAEGIFHQVISASAYDYVMDSQRNRLPGRGT